MSEKKNRQAAQPEEQKKNEEAVKRGREQAQKDNGQQDAPEKQEKDTQNKKSIPQRAEDCETLFKEILNNSSDIVVETLDTHAEKALLVYVDGLINKDLIDRDIIRPMKSQEFNGDLKTALHAIYNEAKGIDKFVEEVLQSNVGLFYGGRLYTVEFKQFDKRGVETPDAETVIRGPKEGFTENLRTNTALVRRKIRTPGLVFEAFKIGRQTNTPVTVVYIKGIVNREILDEVKIRLSKIDTDHILESGEIEQYLEDNPLSPVSGIGVTQKPDKFAMMVLEGRVGILCDGTPHALTLPEIFIENIQTSEDNYTRPLYTTVLRVLRLTGLFITVVLPGLAVAIMTYNHEMMPTVFLKNLIVSTEKTPLPAFMEALLLILMFELLKEAGTRLPKNVGSAITIVGSLIIGEAAVNAGIVGAPMVIIIALTAVTGFIVSNLMEFVVIYRLLFLVSGALMGLVGISAAYFVMMTQIISINSFGVPVLSSFSKEEMKDSLVRFPIRLMKNRPASIAKNNVRKKG